MEPRKSEKAGVGARGGTPGRQGESWEGGNVRGAPKREELVFVEG